MLSANHADLDEGLLWAKSMWNELCRAEDVARANPWLADFLKNLVWPSHVYDREVFVALGEIGWAKCPSDIAEELTQAARGPMATKQNEDAFAQLSDDTRQSKSGALSRAARWHRCITSNLLEDADRRQISPSNADAYTAPPRISAALFEAEASPPTVDDEMLRGIYEDRTWASPSVANYDLIPAATLALVHCNGDYNALRRSWLSMLVPALCLLFHRAAGKESAVLTIGSSQFGVVGLEATGSVQHGVRLVSLIAGERLRRKQVVITDMADWYCCHLECLPPKAAMMRGLQPAAKEGSLRWTRGRPC